MAITLSELKNFPSIERVIVHSLDLSLYIVSVIVGKEEHYVVDKKGHPLKSHNKLDLQQLFSKLAVKEMVLHQQSAYDEMVGQPDRQTANTLEVSLGNSQLGGPTQKTWH